MREQGAGRRPGRGTATAAVLAARQRVVVGGRGLQRKDHVHDVLAQGCSEDKADTTACAGRASGGARPSSGGYRGQRWLCSK